MAGQSLDKVTSSLVFLVFGLLHARTCSFAHTFTVVTVINSSGDKSPDFCLYDPRRRRRARPAGSKGRVTSGSWRDCFARHPLPRLPEGARSSDVETMRKASVSGCSCRPRRLYNLHINKAIEARFTLERVYVFPRLSRARVTFFHGSKWVEDAGRMHGKSQRRQGGER